MSAVVVDHEAGEALLECVRSLRADGVRHITVVDNESSDGSPEALARADHGVRLLRTGANLGYGAGANHGIAVSATELVLVANADVTLHHGAVAALASVLATDPASAIAAPKCPSPTARATHWRGAFRRSWTLPGTLCWPTWPPTTHSPAGTAWTSSRPTAARPWTWTGCPAPASWPVGGRSRRLGGFDEAYFMYAEDADLCWRARRAGWGVAYAPQAVVTHLQGVSTARRPFRMLVAHHRSVFRFATRTERGWRRLALPVMAVVLAVRLGVMCGRQALHTLLQRARPAE